MITDDITTNCSVIQSVSDSIDQNKTWWHSSFFSKRILYNTMKSSTVLTFSRECHDLLMKYISSPFGGHPQGKRTIRPKKKGNGQYQETMLLFPTVLSLCHFSKKTIKEDRQNWESNRRLIGAREMSTNFTDHPRGICNSWCWNICGVY